MSSTTPPADSRNPGEAGHHAPRQGGVQEFVEVFEGSGLGSWALDLGTNRLWLSGASASLIGLASTALMLDLGDWLARVHPEDVAVVRDALSQQGLSGGDCSLDYRVRHRDGSWVCLASRFRISESTTDGAPVRVTGVFIDDTSRKATEEARLAAEARFRAVFEQSPHATTLTRLSDGLCVAANEGASAMFGYRPADMVGRTVAELGVAVDPGYRARLLAALADSDGVAHVESQFRRTDGAVFTGLVSASVVTLDGVPHVLATNRDISERERTAEALRTASRRLALAQQSARAGFWDWDIATDKLSWSPEFFRLFGFRGDETASFDLWRSALHPDDAGAAEARILDALKTRTRLVQEYRIVLGAGVTRWIEALGDTSCDADGQPRRMSGICVDVTERKQTEAALRESHELLVSLARLVPGVIYQYQLHPNGRSSFPYASPGLVGIFEVTPEEVLADAAPVFHRLHPEDAASVSEAIYESARSLEPFYCQFRVVLPRQGLRWRWSQAHPMRTPGGGTLWHGIILDATDRVLAETEKAALQAQLQQAQKMESVGRLAGGVAHDFNNMLNVILGHTELLMLAAGTDASLLEGLKEVKDAARRSADLTRQLLAFARRQPIAPSVLDLNRVVTGMVAMLQRLIGEDLQLEWSPTPLLWAVKVDAAQVDQVLANLCVNARDAVSGRGHVTVRLENVVVDEGHAERLADASPGEYVSLAVTDDGCGMDDETLAHLFEPFYTTKEPGKGTGLGLATVYGIARQNHGFVTVRSQVGRGTRVAVHFPRYVDAAPVSGPLERPAQITRGTETILIAEDEEAVLTMATLVLERLGYLVLAASTAGGAVQLARAHARVDLLITDVVMPESDGRHLAHQLTSIHPELRVLFMSGYPADVIARQGVLEEGISFLQKPFSIETLATAVRALLDRA